MAREQHFVTIIGLSYKFPGMKEVNLGDKILLKKEPSNSVDEDAIHAYLRVGTTLESVGYVGNKPTRETTFTDTKTATEAHSLFGDETEGLVTDIRTMKVGTNPNSKSLVVQLILKGTYREATKMAQDQIINFKLVGPKTLFPKKFELLELVKTGVVQYVELFMREEDQKIVAKFEGSLAGYVNKANQIGLSDYDDIVAAIGNGKNAKITQHVLTDMMGSFTVSESELENEKSHITLKGITTKIVDEGLATQEEMNEKISYMKSNGVTDNQIIGMFGTYRSYAADNVPAGKPDTVFVDSIGLVPDVIGFINAKRNLLFIGDKGCGKNVLIDTMAWLFKRPLSELSMNSGHDNSTLFGGKTIEADETGKTKMGFDLEAPIRAAKFGNLLNIDEINTGLAHMLSGYNSLLDDRRRVTVPGYGLVEADENFLCIATMNIDYQGTFEMNEATADRFVPIIFPPSNNLKEILMEKVLNIVDISIINNCVILFEDIQKLVKDGQISDKAVSIRGFIDACKGVANDVPIRKSLVYNIANRCRDADDRKAIMDAIEDLF
jgi:MoxR-like ATPase